MILQPRIRSREIASFTRQVGTLSLASRLDTMPIEAIKARQLRMLRWILNYAYRNVPFYRDSFNNAGVRPTDVRSIDDLNKIPFLTKDDILKNYPERIVAQGYSPETAFSCRSSGTTGVVGVYLSDWATRNANFALLFRTRSLFGYRPKHRECVFTIMPSRTRWY